MDLEPSRFRSLLFAANLLCTAAHACTWQEVNTTQTTSNNIESDSSKVRQVTVTAATEKELSKRIGAIKTIFSQKELESFGLIDVSNMMLANLPGVYQNGGELRLAGMNEKYPLAITISDAQGNPSNFRLEEISIALVERIEILRQGSAEYSSQALGGILRIVLKKLERKSEQRLLSRLHHEIGSTADFNWRNTQQLEKKTLEISAWLNASQDGVNSASQSESLILGQQGTLQHHFKSYREKPRGHQEGIGFSPTLSFQLENKKNLEFPIGANRSQSIIDEHEFRDFILGRYYPINDTRRHKAVEQSDLNASMIYNASVLDTGKIQFYTGASKSTTNRAQFEHFETSASQSWRARHNDQREHKDQLSFSGKFSFPIIAQHDLVAGWSLSKEVRSAISAQFDEFTQAPIEENRFRQVINNDKYDLFIQDEWRTSDTSSIYAGGRWETYNTQNTEDKKPAKIQSLSIFNPILQGLLALNPENTERLKFGIARNYRPARTFLVDVKPLGRNSNNSFLNPFFQSKISPPELSWSLNAEYEHNGADQLNYTLRTTHRKFSRFQAYRRTYAEPLWLIEAVDVGDAKSTVLELETSFPIRSWMTDAPKLNVGLSVSRNWSNIASYAKPYQLLAPTTLEAKMNINYALSDFPGQLNFNLIYGNSNWIGNRDISINYTPSKLNSSTSFNWKINPKTQIRGNINNLFKRAYPSQGITFNPEYTAFGVTKENASRFFSLSIEHKF